MALEQVGAEGRLPELTSPNVVPQLTIKGKHRPTISTVSSHCDDFGSGGRGRSIQRKSLISRCDSRSNPVRIQVVTEIMPRIVP